MLGWLVGVGGLLGVSCDLMVLDLWWVVVVFCAYVLIDCCYCIVVCFWLCCGGGFADCWFGLWDLYCCWFAGCFWCLRFGYYDGVMVCCCLGCFDFVFTVWWLSLLGFGGGLGLCVFDYFWVDCRGCMRTLDKLVVVCFVVVNLLWGVWFW